MRRGNEPFGSPIRVCTLPGHERVEVLFGRIEIASEPPGKALASELTKPAQEALAIVLHGGHQLDLHSNIQAPSLTPFASRPDASRRRRHVTSLQHDGMLQSAMVTTGVEAPSPSCERPEPYELPQDGRVVCLPLAATTHTTLSGDGSARTIEAAAEPRAKP